MSWSNEMLVRERITRLHAEAAHDRLARSAPRPTPARGPLHAGWWRRLMGLPAVSSTRRPVVARIA